LLEKLRERLANTDAFDAATLEGVLHSFISDEGILIGQIVHAVRVAVTGKGVGFGLFETLALLGRERSLERIDQTLARVRS
jgi:glutamyl-tRNA synthetase